MNAVFNWGWGGSIFRLTGTSPIDAFLPVLMFSEFGFGLGFSVLIDTLVIPQPSGAGHHHISVR